MHRGMLTKTTTLFALIVSSPHVAIQSEDGDQTVAHALTSAGIVEGGTDSEATGACGAPNVLIVQLGPPDDRTNYPWPPQVADLKRLGLTRCKDCARIVGTRNPFHLTKKLSET